MGLPLMTRMARYAKCTRSARCSDSIVLTLGPPLYPGWVYQNIGLQKRVRVISPTYPGFGASQSNNGRTFMSFGEDVKELLDHLKVIIPLVPEV